MYGTVDVDADKAAHPLSFEFELQRFIDLWVMWFNVRNVNPEVNMYIWTYTVQQRLYSSDTRICDCLYCSLLCNFPTVLNLYTLTPCDVLFNKVERLHDGSLLIQRNMMMNTYHVMWTR